MRTFKRDFNRIARIKEEKEARREEARELELAAKSIMLPIHMRLEELPSDRVILRYMFPMSGVVSDFMLYIGTSPIPRFRAKVELQNDIEGRMFYLELKQGSNEFPEPISFEKADRTVISMEGSEVGYKDIWISFMFGGK